MDIESPLHFKPGDHCTLNLNGAKVTVTAVGWNVPRTARAIRYRDASGRESAVRPCGLTQTDSEARPTITDLTEGLAKFADEITRHRTSCSACREVAERAGGLAGTCLTHKKLFWEAVSIAGVLKGARDSGPAPQAPQGSYQPELFAA